jgi:hypothetical protein
LNEPAPRPVSEILADTFDDDRRGKLAATIEHAH